MSLCTRPLARETSPSTRLPGSLLGQPPRLLYVQPGGEPQVVGLPAARLTSSVPSLFQT
ncbi:hypothetical protein N9M16_09225 [Candidatus Dependentiae bacterium]|nr:hypothetical protein [Candidatus Dependentiae bacterium]